MYVADWRNDRVQKLTADGEFLAKFGESGTADGQFSRPSGVAVDSEGNVYVADWGNQRVQVFDPDGRFLFKLRGEATPNPWALRIPGGAGRRAQGAREVRAGVRRRFR